MHQLVYEAEGWEIDLVRRELRAGGARIPIGGRAFELVEVLARAQGQLVTKQDLMSAVWPGAIVEEHTLQVHISSVRKALGASRSMLKTASGRGYRLVADWNIRQQNETVHSSGVDLQTVPARLPKRNIPAATSAVVGRSAEIQRVRDLLSAYRAVTLTGPGGIGKTALALETARSLIPNFQGDIWLVELLSLSDPELVPAAIAATLDLKLGEELSPQSIARSIGTQSMFLLLDNCEHVINAAAAMVETIIRRCPRVTVLATSREILRVEGECAYNVVSLDVPQERANDPGDILGHSAVQLFIIRTSALRPEFAPSAEDLSNIAAICRRVDGIPLAIEFAAARAAALGVQQVASRLDDLFNLLTGGRRTALPRHQKLRATLDWSYILLSEHEQFVLRKLSVFAEFFTLDAALQIAIDGAHTDAQIIEAIEALIAKSLVNHETVEGVDFYRLLYTTRDYARSKLDQRAERPDAARRLAAYCIDLMDKAEADWDNGVDARWRIVYGRRLDDLRNSISWAFSPGGDAAVGVSLVARSAILWTTLGLTEEHRIHAERALRVNRSFGSPDEASEMRLLAALGSIYFHTKGPGVDDDALNAFSGSYSCAVKAGDVVFQMRALSAWSGVLNVRGNYPDALELGKKFVQISGADDHVANRTLGYTAHFLGDMQGARRHLEAALGGVPRTGQVRTSGAHYDQSNATLRAFLARTLWLAGYADRGVRMAHDCVREALSADHAISLCITLIVSACPLAFLTGGRTVAEPYLDLLRRTADKHASDFYRQWGEALDVGMRTREERRAAALEESYRQLAQVQLNGPLIETLAVFGDNSTEPWIIDKAANGFGGWCTAELLRARGQIKLRDEGDKAGSVALFREGLNLATQQGILAWELRAATSLAMVLGEIGEAEDAFELLLKTRAKFTEGFNSIDFARSTEVLHSLSSRRPNSAAT